VADMTVFMFVGVAVWLLGSFSAIPTAILVGIFCLFARAAAVFPLGVFVNCIKRRSGRRMSLPQADWHELSWRHLIIMWHAGLRGGIAMALCLEIQDQEKSVKQELQETTFFIICAFLLLLGGSTPRLLQLLKLPMGVDAPLDVLMPGVDSKRLSVSSKFVRRASSFLHPESKRPPPVQIMSRESEVTEPELFEEGEAEWVKSHSMESVKRGTAKGVSFSAHHVVHEVELMEGGHSDSDDRGRSLSRSSQMSGSEIWSGAAP